MTQEKWNLIAKHLAKETDESEDRKISSLIEVNEEFSLAYNDSSRLWGGLKISATKFDRKRIEYLRDHKIRRANNKQRKIVLQRFLSYAAIFIGLLIGVLFVYNDLKSTKSYSLSNTENGIINLPDGSKITLNKEAVVSYGNSFLKSFNREVRILSGCAFFEISKQEGNSFIVKTDNYDIEVLGTKFNVDNSTAKTTVVLEQGKIQLNNYCKTGIKSMELKPGDMAVFGSKFDNPKLKKVNTEVSKYWMKSKLDFDDYSLNDLKTIFKDYYGKDLVINNANIHINKVGGSAPADDISLIIKGLSIVLKKDLINRNDSIIIN